MTAPTMVDLYREVVKLVEQAWIAPKRHPHPGPARSLVLSKQTAAYIAAEEVLMSGLVRGGLEASIAEVTAHRYVQAVISGFDSAERRARGLSDEPPPEPPGPGLEWVRIG